MEESSEGSASAYFRSIDEEEAKKSVTTRFRSSIASFSGSARRAGEAVWSADDAGYTDLEGEAKPASSVDALEAAVEKGAVRGRAARLLRGDKKPPPQSGVASESTGEAEASPAVDAYVQMDDGESRLSKPLPNGGTSSGFLSRSVNAVLSSFKGKPAPEAKDGGARFSAKPYIAEYAPAAACYEASSTIADALPAGGGGSGGGLWALKAKSVVVDKELALAQAAHDEATARARDRGETLREASARCTRLQRRELFLRELLRHAAELEERDNKARRRGSKHKQQRAPRVHDEASPPASGGRGDEGDLGQAQGEVQQQ